jgi:hypothetical protein
MDRTITAPPVDLTSFAAWLASGASTRTSNWATSSAASSSRCASVSAAKAGQIGEQEGPRDPSLP